MKGHRDLLKINISDNKCEGLITPGQYMNIFVNEKIKFKERNNYTIIQASQGNLLTIRHHLDILPNMKLNNKQRACCETRAAILKALAHPTRLFMIEELADKSYCVCELTEMVGLDISPVSKHLSILKNTGLVNVEERGKHVF